MDRNGQERRRKGGGEREGEGEPARPHPDGSGSGAEHGIPHQARHRPQYRTTALRGLPFSGHGPHTRARTQRPHPRTQRLTHQPRHRSTPLRTHLRHHPAQPRRQYQTRPQHPRPLRNTLTPQDPPHMHPRAHCLPLHRYDSAHPPTPTPPTVLHHPTPPTIPHQTLHHPRTTPPTQPRHPPSHRNHPLRRQHHRQHLMRHRIPRRTPIHHHHTTPIHHHPPRHHQLTQQPRPHHHPQHPRPHPTPTRLPMHHRPHHIPHPTRRHPPRGPAHDPPPPSPSAVELPSLGWRLAGCRVRGHDSPRESMGPVPGTDTMIKVRSARQSGSVVRPATNAVVISRRSITSLRPARAARSRPGTPSSSNTSTRQYPSRPPMRDSTVRARLRATSEAPVWCSTRPTANGLGIRNHPARRQRFSEAERSSLVSGTKDTAAPQSPGEGLTEA